MVLQLLLSIRERRRILLDQLQAFQGQRMEPHVRPLTEPPGRLETEWVDALAGFEGKQTDSAADFAALDAGQDADRAEAVLVKDFSESAQDGLVGVRRDAIDDQLMPGDAKGEHRSVVE